MSTLLEYKCPNCGGSVEFDSGLQKMKCPYCDSEFDVESLKSYDAELQKESEAQNETLNWEEMPSREWDGEAEGVRVYICESCGGEIVGEDTTAATSCPYCGNPVIMKGTLSGALKPDYVIPFQLDKEAAKAALKQHLKGKWLLPKVFKDENRIEEIKGIYVPFWLFDSDADARIRFKGTKVRHWVSGNYNYTETSYYSILRGGKLRFDNVPVDGSSKIADDLMESIEPFDFSKAVDFQTAYLSGYFADKYDVDAEASSVRAGERIRTSTAQAIASQVNGYLSVIPEHTDIKLSQSRAKYVLYPVWILNTDWKGEKYTFAMNGQTGKFVGNLPVDKGAYWRTFGIVAAAATAVCYLLGLLL
ncbi:MAG: hypothetical protein E7655_04845 [Ruminococcaceae bacterium]|nr:hypothetical protein [Oscillospiraceae bacterium]